MSVATEQAAPREQLRWAHDRPRHPRAGRRCDRSRGGRPQSVPHPRTRRPDGDAGRPGLDVARHLGDPPGGWRLGWLQRQQVAPTPRGEQRCSIARGSARCHQGLSSKPGSLPVGLAAREGPPLGPRSVTPDRLEEHHRRGADHTTLFIPAEINADGGGDPPIGTLSLGMASRPCSGYLHKTEGVARLTADGFGPRSEAGVEAETMTAILAWAARRVLVELPITDERGIVPTDGAMHNTRGSEQIAVGDTATITVPELGSLGHPEEEIAAHQPTMDVNALDRDEAGPDYRQETPSLGDIGAHDAFSISSSRSPPQPGTGARTCRAQWSVYPLRSCSPSKWCSSARAACPLRSSQRPPAHSSTSFPTSRTGPRE